MNVFFVDTTAGGKACAIAYALIATEKPTKSIESATHRRNHAEFGPEYNQDLRPAYANKLRFNIQTYAYKIPFFKKY